MRILSIIVVAVLICVVLVFLSRKRIVSPTSTPSLVGTVEESSGLANTNEFRRTVASVQTYVAPSLIVTTYVQFITNAVGGSTKMTSFISGTHLVRFIDERFQFYLDLHNSDDTRLGMGSAEEWWNSGTWTEAKAVDQFMRDITSIGLPVDKIVGHEVTKSEISLKTPDGKTVRVTPFYIVNGKDPSGSNRITAYYRVGKDRIGLVRLFNTL